jgi:hypothetical protein
MAIIVGQQTQPDPLMAKLIKALNDSVTLAEFDILYNRIKVNSPTQKRMKAEFYEAAIVKFGDYSTLVE